MMREEWPEALRWFLEAEKIGGRRAIYLKNQGVVMMEMGRLSEAATLLEEACRLSPGDVVAFSRYGHALADLGRLDDARELLAWAERNFKFQFER
jgi:Flp pilus assembly protein TadD